MTGVIYILTNKSFPDYVKIGYSADIRARLKKLNRSECVPYAFRVYALYDVEKPFQDKELHALIDSLNPNLRAVDTFNGKPRTREFYIMSPEEAYGLLEKIARLSGTEDRLRRCPDPELDGMAAPVPRRAVPRRQFLFSDHGVPVGAELALEGTDIRATVLTDTRILCEGEDGELHVGSPSYFAKLWLGRGNARGIGPWTCGGRRVADM